MMTTKITTKMTMVEIMMMILMMMMMTVEDFMMTTMRMVIRPQTHAHTHARTHSRAQSVREELFSGHVVRCHVRAHVLTVVSEQFCSSEDTDGYNLVHGSEVKAISGCCVFFMCVDAVAAGSKAISSSVDGSSTRIFKPKKIVAGAQKTRLS
jgi:hypothetical protein